jgi:hypothetical protein
LIETVSQSLLPPAACDGRVRARPLASLDHERAVQVGQTLECEVVNALFWIDQHDASLGRRVGRGAVTLKGSPFIE